MNLIYFPSFLLTLFIAFSMISAAPTERSTESVWTPQITFPTSGVTLVVGESYMITWDISKAPSQITNPIGALILRKGNLMTPLVAAGKFPLQNGSVKVTIPWLLNGTDYSFVLFGDSGNTSPAFSISGPSPY